MSMQRANSYLFTTWEGGGNIPPVLTVAAQLVRRGHRVRIMSDAASRCDSEAIGAEFVPWTTAPNRPDRTRSTEVLRDWETASPEESLAHTVRVVMTGPSLAYARDLLAELRREPADLVVSSEMLFGVMAACESVGQRFALFAANLCLFPLAGMPVFGPGVPPPRTQADRDLHAQIRKTSIELTDQGLDEINAARSALGLGPLAHVTDQLDGAAAYLLATSRAFDFAPERLPENLRYVGPQLGEPGWVAPWSPPWPATDRRPLIAVAFSTTFQNHARPLQAVVDAAARLPVRVIVTLGAIERAELRAADNSWLVQSAPHDALMCEAAVVVTHGGHGTVLRALTHRRPLLLVPHGRDQDENAVRVVERGAGLRVPPSAGADEIFRALKRLLDEPAFGEAADRLGGAIAAEAEHTSAVTELEAVARAATA